LSVRVRDAAWALATCGLVVALDQASKAAVRGNVARGETVEVLPFLDLANTRNKGVAFGLAGDVSPWLIGGTLVVLVGLLGYLATRAREGWAVWLPAGLLVGGALGNLADRVRDGAVTDFIDFPYWATFNLADVAIVVGVGMLILLPDREQKPP
jgi:signal peptidase II